MLGTPESALQRYYAEVADLDVPKPEEERAWFARYAELKDASEPARVRERERLKGTIAEGYVRFVIKRARRRSSDERVIEELIQEGNIGILIAIDKFDLARGYRFLTYADWWVNVQMQTFLNSRLVHVPHQTLKDQRALKKKEEREMALGLRRDYSFQEVTTTSIDKVVIAMPEPDLAEEAGPDAATMMRHLNTAGLSRRERLVLTYYFGLRGGEPKTLEQIAELLFDVEGRYLTREGVRQLKDRAVERLRAHLKETGAFEDEDEDA